MRQTGRTLLSIGVCAITFTGCQFFVVSDVEQSPSADVIQPAMEEVAVLDEPVLESVTEPAVEPVAEAVADTGATIEQPVLVSGPEPLPAPALIPEDLSAVAVAPDVSEPAPAEMMESAAPARQEPEVAAQEALAVETLCYEIGNKLGSVSAQDCLGQQLQFADGMSVNQRPLVKRDFLPQDGSVPLTRILIMGGIHGDEYSSISIMFKWMQILAQQGSSFHWRFLPAANPDGLLDGQAVRQNANGVDLNRNFPSADWHASAIAHWKNHTGSNPRRFPGSAPASEPEVQWVVAQIKEFDPQVIVSVHAPYDLLDFDGPAEAPRRIGQLYLNQLGVYPGSLGNYGGVDMDIPVVTLELPSAGIMPSEENIQGMWDDLETWLSINAMSLSSN